MSAFGSLLRRVGSQRGLEPQPTVENDNSNTNSTEPPRGLGGLLRKAKSMRGLESSKSRRRLDQQQTAVDDNGNKENEEGPSGVASFLAQLPDEQESPSAQRLQESPSHESPPATTAAGGGLRNIFRRAASLSSMRSNSNRNLQSQSQTPIETTVADDLQPVLIMTDENHGKVVFQHLEEEDEEQQPEAALEDLTTFDKKSKSGNHEHPPHHHHHHYNISNLFHASLPDLSTSTGSGSSRSSTSNSSLDSPTQPPKQRVFHQPFATKQISSSSSSTPPSSSYAAGHHSFNGFSSSSRDGNNHNAAAKRSNNSEYILHLSAADLDCDDDLASQQPQQANHKEESANGRNSISNSRGLGGRLRTLFRRTQSGRTITEEVPTSSKQQQQQPNLSADVAMPELEGMKKLGHNEIMDHLHTLLAQHQHQEQEEDLEVPPRNDDDDDDEEKNEVMNGLLHVVDQYEDYEKKNRFWSSDEEDNYTYEGSDDDANVEEEDNDDDDEYYDAAAAVAAYRDEPREYDELELFYEEQTFAGVGGSMLLGQAAELMTVLEYDEEDSEDDGDDEALLFQ